MTKIKSETGSAGPERAAVVGESQLRVSILVHSPKVLQDLGCDPAGLLAETGVDPALPRDPENTIAVRTAGRLFARGVPQTGCRRIGLLVGQEGEVATLGVVGLLARNSPDVGTALRSAAAVPTRRPAFPGARRTRGALPRAACSGSRPRRAN